MKLYEIPVESKLYGLKPNGDDDGWVTFGHLDGMYSYCNAYAGDGTHLGVCHLVAWLPLEEYLDGYRVVEEDDGPTTTPPLL